MANWRPDLLSLRVFVAACEEASMARAAERESLVPSAISKRIAEMEEVSGVPLLVRGARGVRPTPAGMALLHHARQIVRSSEKLQLELAEYAMGVRGHVRLLANISSMVEFLPRDLSSFMVGHPQIRIDLQERVSNLIAEGVRSGESELGICQSTVDLSELAVHPYGCDRLSVITHAAHPLARHDAVTFEQTLDYDFVALHPESLTTRRLVGLAARVGRSINHRMYVSTFEAACHIIAENLAIGILAEDAVRPLQKALALRTVRLQDDWALRDIVLLHHESRPLSQPAAALLQHFLERVRMRRAA